MTEATKVAIFFVIILPASVWLVMICRTILAFMLRAWVARSRAPEPSPCPSCGRRGATVGEGVKPIGGQPRINVSGPVRKLRDERPECDGKPVPDAKIRATSEASGKWLVAGDGWKAHGGRIYGVDVEWTKPGQGAIDEQEQPIPARAPKTPADRDGDVDRE